MSKEGYQASRSSREAKKLLETTPRATQNMPRPTEPSASTIRRHQVEILEAQEQEIPVFPVCRRLCQIVW